MTEPRTPPRNIREQLALDEGRRRSAYTDSRGFLTIGVGRLIDARRNAGLSPAEIDLLFDNDRAAKEAELDARLPWWRGLDQARQGVLLNMAFQLGVAGLLKFTTTLGYVQAKQWDRAADAMLLSNWANQTLERAERLSDQMRDGRWR